VILTMIPTPDVVLVDSVRCRAWTGTTERGTRVVALVAAIAIPDEDVSQDEVSELVELVEV
jgi:hypothetical protein